MIQCVVYRRFIYVFYELEITVLYSSSTTSNTWTCKSAFDGTFFSFLFFSLSVLHWDFLLLFYFAFHDESINSTLFAIISCSVAKIISLHRPLFGMKISLDPSVMLLTTLSYALMRCVRCFMYRPTNFHQTTLLTSSSSPDHVQRSWT